MVRMVLAAAALVLGSQGPGWAQAPGPGLPTTSPEMAGFSPEGLNRIEAFFEREIKQNRVPGAVVGIVRDGAVVYLKAFGDQDKAAGRPMKIDSIFGLASMTKPMTAVGVLTLMEQGRLPLYSPVSDYLPGFAAMRVAVKGNPAQTEPQQAPIRIQDLLRHSSGLTYGGRPDTGSEVSALYPRGDSLPGMASSAVFVEAVTKLPLAYQPGTVFEYGISFDVLAAVVEKVTGKTLGGYLAETVWQPLGMADTGFHIDPSKRDRVAQPFPTNPLDGQPQSIITITQDVKFECGGGCAIGTVPDYLRFGQMLLNGGALDGHRVVSPATVALMTSDHLGTTVENRVAAIEPHRAGYGFGLGVAVRTQPGIAAVPGSIGEFTWNGAYGTGFFVDPKQKLVVVFGTAAPGAIRKYYREQVQDLVYGAMTR